MSDKWALFELEAESSDVEFYKSKVKETLLHVSYTFSELVRMEFICLTLSWSVINCF